MKKTMKKSALLSSVAMLIVSAIVLTSATYAWFSASDKVDVKEISATVESSTGLLISIDSGSSWKTSVDVSSYKPGSFSPVSTATGATGSWVTGGYKNSALDLSEATSGSTGQFMMYNLWVKGPDGKVVTVTPDFGSTADSVKKVMKFALYDTTSNKFLNSGVIAADGTTTGYTGTSATGSQVADDSTTAFLTTAGSAVNEVSSYSFTLSGVHKFVAYVWVEGNDPDCKAEDITSGSAIEFALNMSIPTD